MFFDFVNKLSKTKKQLSTFQRPKLNKFMNESIQKEVINLIEKQVEGEYWDFKEEWYGDKLADLVHDILCLVNSTHCGNKYIIIGVANNGKIKGVLGKGVDRKKRMTQSNLMDLLSELAFSPIDPSLSLVSFKYKRKTLDVIVISDSDKIPIVLTKQYRTVRRNMVHTRVNDKNTSIDKGANYWQSEAIWKKHFGLDTTILNKCKAILNSKEDWSGKLFKEFPVYHKIFPEFQITPCEAKFDYEGKKHPISYFYFRPSCSIEPFAIMYHQTKVYYGEYLILNDARDVMPAPDIGKIYLDNRVVCYLYFIKDSINGRLLSLTVDSYPGLGRDLDYNPIIYFENESEKNNFEQFLKRNIALFDSFELDIFAKSAIECEQKSKYINPLMAENIWRAKELYNACMT